MEQPTINTPRCILRLATADDAVWLYELFNDQEVIAYIEGIKWFNADIESTRAFIDSMNINFQKRLGILWCVVYEYCTVGMIMVNDLNDKPFYTFALFPQFRGLELMEECIVGINSYILGSYHKIPSISSLDSNISALRLMQKLSMLHSDKNYKS